MALRAIVSYDGTANDDDALELGRVFGRIGVEVALAYVRHIQESERAAERLEDHEAQELLARGAGSLGGPVRRHVVLSASTGEGLWALAERERADVVVFGSDYRTAPGRVRPQASAERLLAGGPAARGRAAVRDDQRRARLAVSDLTATLLQALDERVQRFGAAGVEAEDLDPGQLGRRRAGRERDGDRPSAQGAEREADVEPRRAVD